MCVKREREREISARCLATDQAAQSFVKSYLLKPCSAYLVDIFPCFFLLFLLAARVVVLFVKSSRSQGPRGCVECAEYNKVSLLSLDHTAYETCDGLAGCFGPVRCSGSLFSAVVARPRPTMMSGRSVPDPARGFPPLSHAHAQITEGERGIQPAIQAS